MTLVRSILRSPLVGALTTPHGVDRYLELVDPMWVVGEVRARIVDRRVETRAGVPVATLTLEPSSAWRGHEAGQFVQVGVEVDGARRTRCFSVSSPESKPGDLITITMRANPEGTVSKHLVHDARIGDVVHLSQADGQFTLPSPLPQELLLLSGGSGITPVMSMLRTLLRRGYGGTITFLHYAQSPDHQIFADELADLPPNVHVRLVYPECGDPVFSTEELARILPHHAEVDAWACGPAGLVERVQETFRDNPRLRVEYFKTSTLGAVEGAVGRTRFAGAGVEAENTGATLLEQAEDAGLTPAYGCRMGICFTCTTRKTEGRVRNVVTGVESDQPDEDVQLCVSAPVGDCVVDL
ncbi:ferredoxin reductase [Nocardioides caldifontis]|uniref:ferredoxin reductase n=1 Tax=Nocardioides caldifontis TaxID=2588938 RepID=UPI001939BCA5|nr:ferredoxin reductase [Nocardioides caldifontis]